MYSPTHVAPQQRAIFSPHPHHHHHAAFGGSIMTMPIAPHHGQGLPYGQQGQEHNNANNTTNNNTNTNTTTHNNGGNGGSNKQGVGHGTNNNHAPPSPSPHHHHHQHHHHTHQHANNNAVPSSGASVGPASAANGAGAGGLGGGAVVGLVSASPSKNPRSPAGGRMKAMTPHSRNALPHKHPPAHVHTPEKFVGLDLSRMKLRALSPSIAIYSFLSELYLQFNNINILPVEMFSALTSLRVLDLSYNNLFTLPAEVSQLLNLRTLLLINNSLQELPMSMGKLFRMEKLAVEGNPLRSPPQDVLDKGAPSIITYMRDRMPAGAPPPARKWLYPAVITADDDDITEADQDDAGQQPYSNSNSRMTSPGGSKLPVRRRLNMDSDTSPSPPLRPTKPRKPPQAVVFDPEVPNQLKQDGEIRVLCYNVLAESYALPDRINYCPIWALQWEYRKHRLLKEISAYDPDIMCLQEVESEQFRTFFQPEFAARGYSGVFKPKSRHRTMDDYRRVDGCATFYKTEMFSEIQDYTFEFQSIALQKHEAIAANGDSGLNRLMTKDNIALALLLQLNNPTATARARPQKDGGCRDKIMVVNTHIHWDPEYSDVKLMQVQILLEKLEDAMVSVSNRSASERAGGGRGRPLPNNTILQATKEIPLLIAGDFNSIPESGVYKLMSERSVDGSHPDFQNFSYGKYTTQGMKHSLNLGSSYNDIVGEPSFTNYTGDFVGVLDYVWYSKSCLQVERVLSPVEEPVVLAQNGALPNPYMCSDHIPLLADFSLNA